MELFFFKRNALTTQSMFKKIKCREKIIQDFKRERMLSTHNELHKDAKIKLPRIKKKKEIINVPIL